MKALNGHFGENNFLILIEYYLVFLYSFLTLSIFSLWFCFRNDFPSTLSFTSLIVGIGGPSASLDIIIFEESEGKPDLLEINPKEIKRIPFTFAPSVSDIGHEIQVPFLCSEKNYHLKKYSF